MRIRLYEWLKPGYIIGGKYIFTEAIAQGRIGLILKVTDREGSTFALKTVRPKARYLATREELVLLERRLANEFRLMMSLHHENIIAAREFIHDDNLGPCFAMEYAPGGDLHSRTSKHLLSEAESLGIFRILLGIVAGLHEPSTAFAHGIAHLDLESKNVLFTATGTPQLCDFHYAREISNEPVLLGPTRLSRGDLDVRADLFQLGTVLYEMFGGNISEAFMPETVPERMRPVLEGLTGINDVPQYQNIQQVVQAMQPIAYGRDERR